MSEVLHAGEIYIKNTITIKDPYAESGIDLDIPGYYYINLIIDTDEFDTKFFKTQYIKRLYMVKHNSLGEPTVNEAIDNGVIKNIGKVDTQSGLITIYNKDKVVNDNVIKQSDKLMGSNSRYIYLHGGFVVIYGMIIKPGIEIKPGNHIINGCIYKDKLSFFIMDFGTN
jgi:hypothetical protein